MASKNVTFDPDAGVPYAANLTIYGGSNFSATYNVTDTSNSAFDFLDQMLLVLLQLLGGLVLLKCLRASPWVQHSESPQPLP